MASYYKRNDKWAFTVDLGRDPATGKRIQKTRSGFERKADAVKACSDLVARHSDEPLNHRMTFNELLEQWYEQSIKVYCRPRTITDYGKLKRRLSEKFGPIALHKLRALDLERYILQFHSEGKTQMARKIGRILHSIFQYAIRQKYVAKNIVDDIRLPQPTKVQKQIWTAEQVMLFLDQAQSRNPTYYIAFLVAAFTGMRLAEVLGLTWDDIDFKQHLIHVRHTLIEIPGEGFKMDTTKSVTSLRSIAVDPFVIEELSLFRTAQSIHEFEHNDFPNLVCKMPSGKPIWQRTIGREMKAIIALTGLPTLSFHDLRHSHASLLLQLGANIKLIQERLGHSDPAITLRIYSHVLQDEHHQVAKMFGHHLRQS